MLPGFDYLLANVVSKLVVKYLMFLLFVKNKSVK